MTSSPSSTEVTVSAANQGPIMSVSWPSTAVQATAAAAPFDARLIPEFDGSTDVVAWMTRAEMLCQLRGVAVESVLPLRLSGGAFAVWAQLPPSSRSSLEAVRSALYAAFALDQYAAYEEFSTRRLQHGESPDVYLADLRRLAALFGGLPDRALACAFVAGLPDAVRQTIRAGSRAEELDLLSVLTRARAVLSDERVAVAAAASRGAPPPARRDITPWDRRCDCETPVSRRVAGARRQRRCWSCGSPGHLAAACQQRSGNGVGESTSPPALSPANQ